MIHRIVKMTFHPGKVDEFLIFFESNKSTIKSFDGCVELNLLEDEKFPNVLFTHSIWQDSSNLDAYRKSDFFGTTWVYVKMLFADKPDAWSLNLINTAE